MATACDWMASYYSVAGQVRKAIEWKEKEVAARADYDVPLNLQFYRIEELSMFMSIGQDDQAAETLKEIEAVFSNMFPWLWKMRKTTARTSCP